MQTDFASLLTVASLRYVQHAGEKGHHQNPDHLVSAFLQDATRRRMDALLASSDRFSALRREAFYQYLLLRTRYYDQAFAAAIRRGIRQIVLLGAGTDTRAYRFRTLLTESGVSVFECDLPIAIEQKEQDARRLGDCSHVRFVELDLDAMDPHCWMQSVGYDPSLPVSFLMEGVTPYVQAGSLSRWLGYLARSSTEGTLLEADFKLAGYADEFGQTSMGRTFRLPAEETALRASFRELGWEVTNVSRLLDLRRRYLSMPTEGESSSLEPPREDDGFQEDVIVSCAVI